MTTQEISDIIFGLIQESADESLDPTWSTTEDGKNFKAKFLACRTGDVLVIYNTGGECFTVTVALYDGASLRPKLFQSGGVEMTTQEKCAAEVDRMRELVSRPASGMSHSDTAEKIAYDYANLLATKGQIADQIESALSSCRAAALEEAAQVAAQRDVPVSYDSANYHSDCGASYCAQDIAAAIRGILK